jgi:uncharacterized membrane protein YuzA (DUF378 family)
MSVDAAEVFAQVQAALLIAIIVEVKGGRSEKRTRTNARIHTIGIVAVLFALAVSLTSVAAGKPLAAPMTVVVAILTATSAFALLTNVLDLIDEIFGVGALWTNIASVLFGLALLAFFTWVKSFVA